MASCKHCKSEKVVKDGFVQGKQRYICRDCDRTSRDGDAREKYSIEKKIKVIKLYTEGVGIRSIERLEDVPAPLLVHWLRNFGKMIREKLSATKIPDDAKEISILELDELFTYCKKKPKKPMFGLLWTETGIRLLIL
jgi:transposase